MSYETITVEPGVVTEIGLNRPERRNALSVQLLDELARAFTEAEDDENCRAILLFGHGDVFSAGHDLYEVAEAFAEGKMPSRFGTVRLEERIWHVQKPVVCAVQGYVGPHAIYLMTSADIVVAAENTRFSFEQTRVGGAGADARVVLLVGFRRFKKWRMMGEAIDAGTAVDWGLINEAIANDDLMSTARAYAKHLSLIPPQNVIANKLAVNYLVELYGVWTMNKANFFFGQMGHGSDQDKEYFQMIREEGLHAALRYRDEKFQSVK